MPVQASAGRPCPRRPLVVAYGLGVDSTAMLVEFVRRGVRPDLILFADTGGEMPETYAYLPVVQDFLRRSCFPPVLTVRYEPTRAAYDTLEQQCLHTGTLPSLAYGGKSCSIKYKPTPQDRFVKAWRPAVECWSHGGLVVKAIGFNADPGDRRRAAHRSRDDGRYRHWYPLQHWGYGRRRCEEVIAGAGLPVPRKSSCFFCPAMKKPEILWLRRRHPELLARAVDVERNARAKLTSVKGLGRSFSWEDYLARCDDLPLFNPPDEEHCS